MGGISVSEARDGTWDAIVVGAGMGGSATAFGLAERGLKVLVIEKGLGELTHSAEISAEANDPDERESIGRWPTKLSGTVDGRDFEFFAPLGSGVGGSTALYAAALDRFWRSDFQMRDHPTGGQYGWPIPYDDFKPFYAKAEKALEVTGDADPLNQDDPFELPAAPEMQGADADMFKRLQGAGMHPFRLHSGFRFVEGCEPCSGQVCLRDCKRHAGNSFLAPAVKTGHVAVLSKGEVLGFEADATRVSGVRLRAGGEEMTLKAAQFALAAGTYFSPAVLMRSANEHWANGLGNQNDQVGRNLMFHTGRSLAIWGGGGHEKGVGKTIAFRDFYETDLGKFGEVQSTGAVARYGNVVYALRLRLETSRFAKVPLLWHLARIPAFAASKALGSAAVFEAIMEDLPYTDNRVVLDEATPSGIRFHYTVHEELQQRYDSFSKAVSGRLKGLRHIWLDFGIKLNFGHPTGTCRIGDDPRHSVADASGKVHGVENLYIADGSFFPTSGGTNPSLSIAAHGLRVGEKMGQQT